MLAGLELDAVLAEGVLDGQQAALVFVGFGKEQRRRDVGAHVAAAVGQLAHGVVGVKAVVVAVAAVAVEEGRQDFQRQRGGEEHGVAAERLEHETTQGRQVLGVLRQLFVVLGLGGLQAGRNLPV